MTRLLEKAFEKASELAPDDQDEFARLMLAELESEERWAKLFAHPNSKTMLERLAKEALEDHRAGRTTPLNPDEM